MTCGCAVSMAVLVIRNLTPNCAPVPFMDWLADKVRKSRC